MAGAVLAMGNEMSEDQKIVVISRGDIVRALRQHISDIGITKDDIREMIRGAVKAAASDAMIYRDIGAALEKAAEKAVKASEWDARRAMADALIKRFKFE